MSSPQPAPSALPLFETRNFRLAAYLWSRGFAVRVTDHPDPSLFLFAAPVSDDLLGAIARFERDEATVAPAAFDAARKALHRAMDEARARRGGAR